MRTFSLLKNIPIYGEKTAEVLGTVSDICIDENSTVTGLLMEGKGLFERDRFVPIDCISSFGTDGVMINDTGMITPYQNNEQATYFLHTHHDSLFHKPMITSEGEKLGLLEDVYFLEEVGTIIGYEVTDGFFADITEGKKVVKTSNPLIVGKDAIVVNVKS